MAHLQLMQQISCRDADRKPLNRYARLMRPLITCFSHLRGELPTNTFLAAFLHTLDRLLPVTTGSYGSRLCENACAILNSALLRKICARLVNQQTRNLHRNAIFVPVLTVKPAQKRFHTAWVGSGLSRQEESWPSRMQMIGQLLSELAVKAMQLRNSRFRRKAPAALRGTCMESWREEGAG